MPRCGKSVLSRLLAQRLGFSAVDLDRIIEERFFEREKSAKTCRQIYQTFGQDCFRTLEREALQSIAATHNIVLATGGGCAADPDNHPLLKKCGIVVYIQVSAKELFQRMAATSMPSFLKHSPRVETVQELLIQRHTHYCMAADLIVDITGCSIDDSTILLLNKLQSLQKKQ